MSILEAVFMEITRAEMGPIRLSSAARDEMVATLALIPLMSMNLRAKWDDEVVVTDASPLRRRSSGGHQVQEGTGHHWAFGPGVLSMP